MSKNKLKGELRLFKNVRAMAISGLFAAISLILAFLAKEIFGSGPLRFTIENIPIFLSSFLFGPAVGAVTALCADLVSCLITGMAPIPLVSVGAALIGIVSGSFYKYLFVWQFHTLLVLFW